MLVNKLDFKLKREEPKVYIDEIYFQVDDIIAPVIELLNKKGFKTRNCCGGHYPVHNYIYIMFDKLYDLPKLDGFDFSIMISHRRKDDMCIKIEPATVIKSYIDFLELHKSLYTWATNLNEVKYITDPRELIIKRLDKQYEGLSKASEKCKNIGIDFKLERIDNSTLLDIKYFCDQGYITSEEAELFKQRLVRNFSNIFKDETIPMGLFE